MLTILKTSVDADPIPESIKATCPYLLCSVQVLMVHKKLN